MNPNKILRRVSVSVDSLILLIHWARRYADMRRTFVPGEFNRIYKEITDRYPFLKDKEFLDETLTENGRFFPFAQDGDFDPDSGMFDATRFIR